MPVCHMANVEGRLGLASEGDLAACAAWLGQAQPLPADEGFGRGSRLYTPSARMAHLAALMIRRFGRQEGDARTLSPARQQRSWYQEQIRRRLHK